MLKADLPAWSLRLLCGVVLFCLLAAGHGNPSLADGGPPNRAIMLCNNMGSGSHSPLLYACADTRRIADTLAEMGWAEPGHIHLFEGVRGRDVSELLGDVAGEWTELPATILIYVQGHGYTDGFRMGGSTIAPEDIVDRLEALAPGAELVFMFNSCRGPLMANLSPEMTEQVVTERAGSSTIIYSSAQGFVSYERVDIGASIFGAAVLQCLYGGSSWDGFGGDIQLPELFRCITNRSLHLGKQAPQIVLPGSRLESHLSLPVCQGAAQVEVSGLESEDLIYLMKGNEIVWTEHVPPGVGGAIRIPSCGGRQSVRLMRHRFGGFTCYTSTPFVLSPGTTLNLQADGFDRERCHWDGSVVRMADTLPYRVYLSAGLVRPLKIRGPGAEMPAAWGGGLNFARRLTERDTWAGADLWFSPPQHYQWTSGADTARASQMHLGAHGRLFQQFHLDSRLTLQPFIAAGLNFYRRTIEHRSSPHIEGGDFSSIDTKVAAEFSGGSRVSLRILDAATVGISAAVGVIPFSFEESFKGVSLKSALEVGYAY